MPLRAPCQLQPYSCAYPDSARVQSSQHFEENEVEFDHFVDSEKTAHVVNDFFMKTVMSAARPLRSRAQVTKLSMQRREANKKKGCDHGAG